MLAFLKLFTGFGVKQWAILIAIVGVIAYIGYLQNANDRLNAKLIKEKNYTKALESENDALVVKVKNWAEAYQSLNNLAQKCSNAVDDIEKTQQSIQKKAVEAIKKAKDESKAIQDQINIIAMRADQPEGDCKASLDQVRSDLKEIP